MAVLINDLNRTKIKEIFNNMEYGDNIETLENAKKWIGSRVIGATTAEQYVGEDIEIKDALEGNVLFHINTPTIDVMKKMLNIPNKLQDLNGMERSQLLNKFASEIDSASTLISELEILLRSILAKDTKKCAIPMLVDSLKYYSTWAANSQQEFTAGGFYVAILSDQIYLGCLGKILGPALAAGYNVILQVEGVLSAIGQLLIDLALKAGYPAGAIQIIPGSVDISVFNNKVVKTVTILDNLHRKKFDGVKNFRGINVRSVKDEKIPMIIFSSADLDSAVECAINSVWGYQGQLPWSVNNIFVQEDIFKDFVSKLKCRLIKVKTNLGNDKMADFSYSANFGGKLTNIMQDAALQGVEVYQPDKLSKEYQPTVLIGGKVYGNNVITADKIDVPIATILPFRTTNEAISLANNTKQGFAATVWTENIGLANEVSKKLKVGTVWINCHGVFAPHVSFSSIKSSGTGYFGGKEGYLDVLVGKESFEDNILGAQHGDVSQKINVQNIINNAKKGQEAWAKLTIVSRTQHIRKLADLLQCLNEDELKGQKQLVCEWSKILNNAAVLQESSNSGFYKNYEFKTHLEPLGVIAIDSSNNIPEFAAAVTSTSLAFGNSVIILNHDASHDSFYAKLNKLVLQSGIPNGVFNTIMAHRELASLLAMSKDVGSYISKTGSSISENVLLKDVRNVNIIKGVDSIECLVNYVTLAKKIWCNVGQSFV